MVCSFGSQGEILSLAIKFARLCIAHKHAVRDGVDAQSIHAAMEEIQRKVGSLGTVKSWCTNITESTDKIRAHVAGVMTEVSEIVEKVPLELAKEKSV
jgi:hypothetical protein